MTVIKHKDEAIDYSSTVCENHNIFVIKFGGHIVPIKHVFDKLHYFLSYVFSKHIMFSIKLFFRQPNSSVLSS